MSELKSNCQHDAAVDFTGNNANGQKVRLGHEDALLDLFQTDDSKQAQSLLFQCMKVLSDHESDDERPGDDERAFMLSIVRDIKPRDAVERMLAVQMAATHVAAIRSGGWLSRATQIPQAQAHYAGFTKLTRAFASQVETLRKHRSGGEQKVTVQHVHVSDGGQAIVGHVDRGGEAHGKR